EDPGHVSHTMLDRASTQERSIEVPVMRLRTIMQKLSHDDITVLKMDIEGAEYAVIKDIADSDIRPRQILVEFHHRFPEVTIEQTATAITTLRTIGYSLYWVSPSNEEFSFLLSS
ncbi:MAG: FkbM family methyltransferase, partial [Rhodothermales bacterium]|nr:FkbM family methyltransferase [Rhodothermales bacterium]